MLKDAAQKYRDGPETFFKDNCREDRTKSTITKSEFL